MTKLAAKFGIERRVDTPDLEIWVHEGAPLSSRLVVSCSSVGTKFGAPPPIEFPRLATDEGRGHALFVVDKRRSWMNAEGLLEQVVAEIERMVTRFGIEEVVTLGNSMGGYNAALIAGFTRVDVALCFSPQSSVHPDIAGDDLRWPRYRVGIDAHRFSGLDDHLSDTCQYIAVFGDRPREAPQFRRFPEAHNSAVIMLPGQGHGTAFTLKKFGLLGEAVRLGFGADVDGLVEYLGQHLNAYYRKPAQTGLAPATLPAGAMERAAQAALASGEMDID